MKKTYEVTILNHKFHVKTENSERHVKRIADYVNKVFYQIKKSSQTISNQNVAILGALNIAEEMLSKEDHTKVLVQNWKQKLEKSL